MNEALKVGDSHVFLLAIRDIIEARHVTILNMAETLNLDGENLSRLLSNEENPELNELETLLDVLGYTFVIQEKSGFFEINH